jgi:very-short-patch-repair endonuclease/flavin-binding protein dodecin
MESLAHLTLQGDADALFASQHGVAARAQLRQIGESEAAIRWALKTGKWEPVHRGVYRLKGAPVTWHQQLAAALLAAGPRAWISHRSAAALHGLPGYQPGHVELTTMHNSRHLAGTTVYKTQRPSPFFPTMVHGIVTGEVNLTLLNLAAVDSCEQVEEAMEDAIARRLTSVRKLDWFLSRAGGRGVSGSEVLRKLVDLRVTAADVPQSVMESRMNRLIRQAMLPPPLPQHWITDKVGRVVARPDFAYPDQRLAIECQSYRWHFGRRKWHHDLERSNELTRLGWRVLYFTWDQLRIEPDSVLDRIRSELGYLTLG